MKLNGQAKEIGPRLRKLRTAWGMSQADAAQAAGLSPGCICQYEAGRHLPGSEALYGLADAYKVTPDYILGYHGHNLNSTFERAIG